MNTRKHTAKDSGQAIRMESLQKIITFHVRKSKAEGCNGPCDHDIGTSYSSDDASYSSDDLPLSFSVDLSWSGTSSSDLDN